MATEFDTTPAEGYSSMVSSVMVRRLPSMAAIPVVVDDSGSDAFVQQVIAGVEAMALRWLNRDFELHEGLSETHDGDGARLLVLNRIPIVELTSITILGHDNAASVLSLDDLSVNESTGFVEFHGRVLTSDYGVFPRGKRNVVVVYDCGYDAPPADVLQGLCVWVAEECNRLVRDTSLIGETISKYRWQAKDADDSGRADPPIAARRYLASYRNLGAPYWHDRK